MIQIVLILLFGLSVYDKIYFLFPFIDNVSSRKAAGASLIFNGIFIFTANLCT